MAALETQKIQSEAARKEIRCCDEPNQQYSLTLTDEDITDLLVHLAFHGIAEGSIEYLTSTSLEDLCRWASSKQFDVYID